MDLKIRTTKNYNSFVLSKKNRPIDYKHVEKVKKQLAKTGFNTAFPIVVTNSGKGVYTIMEGQHRFLACKELDIYFSFVEVDIPEDDWMEQVSAINDLPKKWTLFDFASISEDEQLKKIVAFAEKNPEYRTIIFQINGVCSSSKRAILNKKITFNEELTINAVLIFKRIMSMGIGAKTRQNVTVPTLKFIIEKNIDIDRLAKNIEKQPVKFTACATSKQFAEMIEYFYNYDYPKANRIKFDI